jgi:hypothetical protein
MSSSLRERYLKHFVKGSNVVALQSGIQKAILTSETANKAVALVLLLSKYVAK